MPKSRSKQAVLRIISFRVQAAVTVETDGKISQTLMTDPLEVYEREFGRSLTELQMAILTQLEEKMDGQATVAPGQGEEDVGKRPAVARRVPRAG